MPFKETFLSSGHADATGEPFPRLMRERVFGPAGARDCTFEQPLPADRDEVLAFIPHPIPICADESAHTRASLPALKGKYDAVNIKLDKAGGLTEALAMAQEAHERGFSVMVGCMVATSLAIAPAMLVAQDAHRRQPDLLECVFGKEGRERANDEHHRERREDVLPPVGLVRVPPREHGAGG